MGPILESKDLHNTLSISTCSVYFVLALFSVFISLLWGAAYCVPSSKHHSLGLLEVLYRGYDTAKVVELK